MSQNDDKKTKGGFDPEAELWDRLIDDVARRGTPCYDTVEQLIKDACQQPDDPKPGPEE